MWLSTLTAMGALPPSSSAELRTATLADAQRILVIYNHFVANSTATFDLRDRTLDEQKDWLTSRSGAHPATVAEIAGQVVGFGSLSEFRPRPAYRTTVENSVYVDPAAQGQGVGRLLLADLIERATEHGFHTMIARVAGDNEASVGLHSALGFETVGVEREIGRKFGRWLDVIVMQRML